MREETSRRFAVLWPGRAVGVDPVPHGKPLTAFLAVVALVLGAGCKPTPDTLVGTYSDTASGPPVLEISKSGDTYHAVATLGGRRFPQVVLVPFEEEAKPKFFQRTMPENLVGLSSLKEGLFVFSARPGSDVGGHRMATDYLMYTELGYIDLYKK